MRPGGEPSDMTPAEHRADHWRMLRFMALNAFFGVCAGLAVAGALIWFDTGGIGTRIANADNPLMPILLIAVPLALTFGGAAAASAIMLMPYNDKDQR